ncbi:c-type cytochrome [Herbaspirillum sp.]|uniref:c-type cytochrome n=1 Tax=Herbaspirillum TaxID=963 RepID=UPI0025886028|nr:c-type cytochrome [Herbaspirillum sp.]MCP3653806.1 c-type cytochrome [Herbaspirillum sp.]MCP3947261.1 c-type cytochrome [Herbaspirillum sp.]MCP4032633.1 c-type cytochrome [Herbaspirillum sp.]MCP4555763.1 c-type cytochrome [Herbaspirillum sp.]
MPTSAASLSDDLPSDFSDALDASTREQVLRGRYVARLGDCVACHTQDKRKPMAGGLALETPFGKLYSTNITPDRQTGIGQYSFAQFDRVMREGVTADGRHLYPAMPYPSYAKMSEEDMRALYVYLMQAVTPLALPNRPLEMSFPFNQRWGMALWNMAFLQAGPFRPDPAQSAQWNRGAYIVQGPGHCGACHTPRGIGMQEKTMSESGSNGPLFLSGETVENWRALDLRGRWQPADVAGLLRTGSNRFGTVAGNMVDVVQHSTQYMSDEDLLAIGTYLASLPSPARQRPPQATAAPVAAAIPADLYLSRGGLGYVQFCATCHRSDGNGVQGLFPPLAGNPTLQSNEPASLIHIMLTGWRAARTHAQPKAMSMPAFSALSDGEIAEILNFARTSWGGRQQADISERQVARLRAELGAQPANTVGPRFETPRLADMLKEKNATQLILGARLNIETGRLLPQHVGNGLNCASCHLNAGTVGGGSPYVGVSAAFPTYAARAGRVITLEDRINGCFPRSMNGKPLPPGSQDMQAMLAYIEWMRRDAQPGEKVPGRGIGKIDQKLKPDPVNGERIYHAQCAACHGAQGEGIRSPSGQWVYPALWGAQSFNIGAGMARTYTAAAFVKRNMPIALHDRFPLGQGGLSDQEAVDVAEFFTHQPRPDFAPKTRDWPRDKKPADARY